MGSVIQFPQGDFPLREQAHLDAAQPVLDEIERLLREIALPPTTLRFARAMIWRGVATPEESEARWNEMKDFFEQMGDREGE